MLQAFLSEANANWALAAMPALVLWLARWLGAGTSRPGMAALAVNGAICLVLIAVTIAGSLGPLTPQSDPLRRLQREDLVETRPYRSIFLTEAGKALAEASRERHCSTGISMRTGWRS